MNKVNLVCSPQIDEYKLNREIITNQLQYLITEEDQTHFVVAYKKNSEYTLLGEVSDGTIILTHIEKAIVLEKMDNHDLFS